MPGDVQVTLRVPATNRKGADTIIGRLADDPRVGLGNRRTVLKVASALCGSLRRSRPERGQRNSRYRQRERSRISTRPRDQVPTDRWVRILLVTLYLGPSRLFR